MAICWVPFDVKSGFRTSRSRVDPVWRGVEKVEDGSVGGWERGEKSIGVLHSANCWTWSVFSTPECDNEPKQTNQNFLPLTSCHSFANLWPSPSLKKKKSDICQVKVENYKVLSTRLIHFLGQGKVDVPWVHVFSFYWCSVWCDPLLALALKAVRTVDAHHWNVLIQQYTPATTTVYTSDTSDIRQQRQHS